MQDPTRSYKYSCRKCTIRQRCLDDKSYGPGLKKEIVRRFANHTDTFETWDLLQQDCLLIRYERQEAQEKYQESSLARRLRQARQLPQEPPPVDPEPAAPSTDRVSSFFPVTPPPSRPVEHVVQAATPPVARGKTPRCGISIASTKRILRLPDNGDMVFGRFEHGFSNPPDVDLTLEDGEIPSVSRRHALLTSVDGQHWLEDMGSINGTYVNGHQLPLGKSVKLGAGDRILLARCRLVYTPLPEWVAEPDPRRPHITSLLITHTGQRLELPQKDKIMVGRPDPALGYVPDVDLGVAGDIAMYVSRRHARIIMGSGWHFLEEVGSAAGTRLNGHPIRMGDSPAMLRPGDQIWMGGCVIAYEWQLR